MDTKTYDMYRNLGWTVEEIWQYASEMEHYEEGVDDNENI